jgi:hypothetical protein
MKIIKKYTALQVLKETLDDNVRVKLTYGKVSGEYYSRSYPEEFDTEEEAYKHAYELDKWASWLIVPIIRFDNII